MKEVFLKFLTERELLDIFYKETRSFVSLRKVNDFLNRCASNHPELIIMKAFDWKKSNEGFKFWLNINKEWQELCKQES